MCFIITFFIQNFIWLTSVFICLRYFVLHLIVKSVAYRHPIRQLASQRVYGNKNKNTRYIFDKLYFIGRYFLKTYSTLLLEQYKDNKYSSLIDWSLSTIPKIVALPSIIFHIQNCLEGVYIGLVQTIHVYRIYNNASATQGKLFVTFKIGMANFPTILKRRFAFT